MISRVVVIAAMVAALAVVGAQASGGSCSDCQYGVKCAETLNDCVTGEFNHNWPAPNQNTKCSNELYYACAEKPWDCRYVNNCTEPAPKCQCNRRVYCYSSLNRCKEQKNAVEFPGGNNADCAEIERPVYACSEEPDVCRVTNTCEVCRGGHGTEDPHFVGFDGSQYYFEGAGGQDYNIITDNDFQLNAHFVRLNQLKGTYMGRLGVRFGENSFTFDPHFGVFYNNTLMTSGEVDLPEGSFSVQTNERMTLFFQNDVYQFSANVAIEKGVKAESYINVHAALIGVPSHPHGILGQTARIAIPGADPLPKPFAVEGKESDYHVTDGLLGTEFTFNKFVGAPQPITVSATRARRAAATPLFEAKAQ